MQPINLVNPPNDKPKAKRSKFGNTRVRVDDISFDSKREASYYGVLKRLQQTGVVTHFHRQVIFDMGGGTTYRCDFLVFYADGRVHYVDCKGYRTKAFIRNKKQVKAFYGVEIQEV